MVRLGRYIVGLFSGTHQAKSLIALFFSFLFIGLFLGDGKQGVIEVYGAALILILWAIRTFFVQRKTRHLPRDIYTSWVVVFGVVGISALSSDSLGFSVSWIVRLLSGYFVYRFFYDFAENGTARFFARGFFVFVVVAGVASVVVSLVPPLQHLLPSMNLVSLQFGHNHLADLLVFAAPMVFLYISTRRGVLGTIVLIMFVSLLFFTAARLSWVIVSIYILLGIGWQISFLKRGALVAAAFLVFALYFYVAPGGLMDRRLSVLSGLRSTTVRAEYWKQAWKGFMERPITGTGPGTFSLVSLRYQRAPLSSSWFAHSGPMQILSELGGVGFIAFVWLMVVHMRMLHANKKDIRSDRYASALLLGCLLTFVYGLVEFNLDYLITQFIFFSAIGLVSGSFPVKNGVSDGSITKIAIIIIGAYYVFWVVGNGFGFFAKRSDLAFFFAPFDSAQALLYLEDGPEPSSGGTRFALMFHRKNPEILASLGRVMKAKGDAVVALGFIKEAVFADPQNMNLVASYITSLTSLPPEETGKNLLRLLRYALPSGLHGQVAQLEPDAEDLGRAAHDLYLIRMPNLKERYVSVLYALGYQTLVFRPDLTRRLWVLARDLHPDFAATHVELARLYQYIFRDDLSAQNILRECEKHESPREQCHEFLGKPLLPPGDFYEVY